MFRASIVGLWFVSAGIAAFADFRTCDNKSDGGLYLLPLMGFAIIAYLTWNIKIVRISGALVSIAFFVLMIYMATTSGHIELGPCDRKGDEQIEVLFLLQIFGIPILWMAFALLGLIGAMTSEVIGRILVRVGLKRSNTMLDSDAPSDRQST